MALSGSQNTGTLTARSDNLNSISNRITLFGNVWVQDGDASLYCDSLHIYFRETPGAAEEKTEKTIPSGSQEREIEWIEATGNVKISQKDHRIETQKAVYKMADSTAIFEEHTSWSSDRLTGESDQLFMWAEPRSAQAIGNVKVIVPVEGKIQPLELFGPQAETNSVSSTLSSEGTVKTQAPELRINSPRMNVDEKQINFFDKVSVEIQSKEADFTHMTMSQLLLNFEDKKTEETETTKYLDNIVATGKVHIIQTTSGPERKTQQMKSETMKVQLDEKTGAVVNVVAEQDVIMEQEDVVASGKKAVFDTATQLLELTGYPVAKMPRGTLYADKMIWDRKANVFKGVSNFRIDGQKPE